MWIMNAGEFRNTPYLTCVKIQSRKEPFLLKKLKQGFYPDFVAVIDEVELQRPDASETFPLYTFKIQFEVHPLKLSEPIDLLAVATWEDFFLQVADKYELSGINAALPEELAAFDVAHYEDEVMNIRVYEHS